MGNDGPRGVCAAALCTLAWAAPVSSTSGAFRKVQTYSAVHPLNTFHHTSCKINSSSLRFNRQTDLALERHIDEVWTKRVSKEPWLFNGAKFRLHSFCLADPQNPPSTPLSHGTIFHHTEDQINQGQRDLGEIHNRCISQTENAEGASNHDYREFNGIADKLPPHPAPLLTLRLGLTCYKDYLGTNWSCGVAKLRQRGEAEFGDPLTLLAQPLGVGAILCTSNGQVVMIRRSQKVAEAGGLLDIPGGHPEPKVI